MIIRSGQWRLLVLIAASGIAAAVSYRDAAAKEPVSKTVLLKEIDLSAQIQPVPRKEHELDLLPLIKPGYEELRGSIWMGGPNIPAAYLANGADPNALSPEGDPILFYAIWVGDVEKVHDFLMAGADPNRRRKDGTTPLDHAAWHSAPNIIAKLMEFGSDPLLRSRNGGSALENARYHKQHDKVKVLEVEPQVIRKTQPPKPPVVLRRPTARFGSSVWSIPGGGQAAVYSPDSRQLIVGGQRGAIRFLDAETGAVQRVLRNGTDEILGLTFIPRTQILVSACSDDTVRLWNTKTGEELVRLRAHSGQGKALAVSPDGRYVCTGSHLWEIESTEPLRLAEKGRQIAQDIALWSFFTPDSRYLVSRLNNNDVWIWSVVGGGAKKLKGLGSNDISAIRWRDLTSTIDVGNAAADDLLAVIVDQYTILTGPAELLKAWDRKARGMVGNARAVACSPNGQYLAGVGHASGVYMHDLENRKQVEYDGHSAGLQCVAASPDGKWIATGSDDCTVRIWEAATQKTVETIEAATFVYSVRFSPDSKLLAIGDNGGNVYLWDLKARKLNQYHVSGRITDLAFDSKENYLAVLGWEIQLLDLESRQVRAKISSDSSQQGKIAISSSLGFIVGTANSQAAGEEFKVPNAWSLDGKELFAHKDLFSEKLGHRSFIDAVAFSPDGRYLASSSQCVIRLWDVKDRKPIGDRWIGHLGSINQLVFSPDGKWLASAGDDGTARIWDVSKGQQVIVLDADVKSVSGVDFTPTGEVVTANGDGTAHQWKLLP